MGLGRGPSKKKGGKGVSTKSKSGKGDTGGFRGGGREGKGSKGGGKGGCQAIRGKSGSKGKDGKGKGTKVKGKGKGKSTAPVGTRRERKQLQLTGKPIPGTVKEPKIKKCRKTKENVQPESVEPGNRWERRRLHKKLKLKEERKRKKELRKHEEVVELPPITKKRIDIPAPICKSGHSMEKRSENPKTYFHRACCDVCGLENLLKKRKYFFHCSFCHFDLCPKCGGEFKPEERSKRKRDPRSKAAKEPPQKNAKQDRSEEKLSCVEVTEETALSRAPLVSTPVSSWIEGVPV